MLMRGGIDVDNLKSLREEKRVSQQKLAEQIGTNQQNIHRYEHGFYEPDIQTLKLLANFFNTSIDYLVGYTDMRHKIEAVEKFDLNEEEAALLEKYRTLALNERRGIMGMIDALLQSEKAP